jgi:hypothetical protein
MSNLTNNFDFPPPVLPSALQSVYNSLDSSNRSIFVKVFRFLWGVVLPYKRYIGISGVLYSYWAVDLLRHRCALSCAQLSVLSYIYQISKQGSNIIHSEQIYISGVLPHYSKVSKQILLSDIVRAGYITRQTRNPEDPFYSRSYRRQPVFIRLAPSGIRLIEDMEKDLYKILVNGCLDGLKGKNKPRKRSVKRSGAAG